MQRVAGEVDGRLATLELPHHDATVMPGVTWGRFEHPLTPAFWAAQAWMSDLPRETGFRLGTTLAEEVVACLLGGHGAPAEVGLAAFVRVRDELRRTGAATLPLGIAEELLLEPLDIRGRPVRYRFARTRARYLAASLDALRGIDEETLGDVDLRDALNTLPGIGPKTASWIVRNRRASDAVAILDIHIVRACQVMGVFPQGADPARGYRGLERRYLDLCLGLGSPASVMDAVMWTTMRKMSRALHNLIVDRSEHFTDKLSPMKNGGAACPAAAAVATTPAVRVAFPT